MNYREIKSLKEKVEHCLKEKLETRNSDIELTKEVWKRFYSELLYSWNEDEYFLPLKKLGKLPYQSSIKRVRAKLQSKGKYLPTNWKIARLRGVSEDEWRIAMNYPVKPKINSEKPSWLPPSEKNKKNLFNE